MKVSGRPCRAVAASMVMVGRHSVLSRYCVTFSWPGERRIKRSSGRPRQVRPRSRRAPWSRRGDPSGAWKELLTSGCRFFPGENVGTGSTGTGRKCSTSISGSVGLFVVVGDGFFGRGGKKFRTDHGAEGYQLIRIRTPLPVTYSLMPAIV